ncbi:MAG: DinB family protein [Chloroflexota bacterium]
MDNTPVTTAEILRRMQNGWDELQAYLKTLTPEQLTRPKDAAGWAAKDHIMHLVVWEDGMEALLSGQSRQARMGISDATWQLDWHADNYFHINDEIFQQRKNKSLDAVLATFDPVQARMVKTVGALSDADLMRPYNSYDTQSKSENPVFGSIVGNTFGHYEEHRPWIEAIVKGASFQAGSQ